MFPTVGKYIQFGEAGRCSDTCFVLLCVSANVPVETVNKASTTSKKNTFSKSTVMFLIEAHLQNTQLYLLGG